MIPIFNNEDAKFDSPIAMIAFFSISLVFSSIVISWMLLNAYGVSISGLTFPDFAYSVNYDLTVDDSSDKVVQVGSWDYATGTGYTSTDTDTYLLFKNVQPTGNGQIINNYVINNPSLADYSIVLSYSDTYGAEEILVTERGFYFRGDSLIDIIIPTYIEFYPYEGANQLSHAKIKTVYNPNNYQTGTHYLDFYLNDNLIFTIDGENARGGKQGLLSGNVYWAGLGSKDSIGLNTQSFSASSDTSTEEITSLLKSIQLWVTAILQLILWNVSSEYLPWELNVLLIKSQAFCIGLGVFFWARGTS